MADAGLGRGVGVGCFAEPGALVDQAAETTSPLMQEFVDVVAAHLVDDEQHDEFGASGRCLQVLG